MKKAKIKKILNYYTTHTFWQHWVIDFERNIHLILEKKLVKRREYFDIPFELAVRILRVMQTQIPFVHFSNHTEEETAEYLKIRRTTARRRNDDQRKFFEILFAASNVSEDCLIESLNKALDIFEEKGGTKMTTQDNNTLDSDKKFAKRLAQIGKFAEEKRVNTLQIIAGFMAGLEIGTNFNNQKVSLNDD